MQPMELRESQLSENRVSHMRFEVQNPVSPREKFKSGLPFLTEQFPPPVQGIQISVIIPDTTNQFFPFTLCYVPSVSLLRWERDCVRQQKNQQMERTAEGGWMNWQPWSEWCLPMRRLQMQQMPGKSWLRLINLDCWDKSEYCSNAHTEDFLFYAWKIILCLLLIRFVIALIMVYL